MASALRCRKRIYSIERAPGGSAFQKCEFCGAYVIFVLLDMHEEGCRKREIWGGNKRLRSSDQEDVTKSSEEYSFLKSSSIASEPRSPFLFFMEGFRRSCADSDWIQIDREGFEKWKNMSKEERQPYKVKADEVNSAYDRALIDSVEEVDGTDSETVDNYYLEDEDEDCTQDSGCYLTFDSSAMSIPGGLVWLENEDS